MNIFDFIKKHPCKYISTYALTREKIEQLKSIDIDVDKKVKREIIMNLMNNLSDKLEVKSYDRFDFKERVSEIECYVFTSSEMMEFIKAIENEFDEIKKRLFGMRDN